MRDEGIGTLVEDGLMVMEFIKWRPAVFVNLLSLVHECVILRLRNQRVRRQHSDRRILGLSEAPAPVRLFKLALPLGRVMAAPQHRLVRHTVRSKRDPKRVGFLLALQVRVRRRSLGRASVSKSGVALILGKCKVFHGNASDPSAFALRLTIGGWRMKASLLMGRQQGSLPATLLADWIW